jgi:hypothetical protein
LHLILIIISVENMPVEKIPTGIKRGNVPPSENIDRGDHLTITIFMRKTPRRGNARLNTIRVTGFQIPLEFDSITHKLMNWPDLKPKLQQYAAELMLLVPFHPGPAGIDDSDLLKIQRTESPSLGEATDDQAMAADDPERRHEVTSTQKGDDANRPLEGDRFWSADFVAGNSLFELDSPSPLPTFDCNDQWDFGCV